MMNSAGENAFCQLCGTQTKQCLLMHVSESVNLPKATSSTELARFVNFLKDGFFSSNNSSEQLEPKEPDENICLACVNLLDSCMLFSSRRAQNKKNLQVIQTEGKQNGSDSHAPEEKDPVQEKPKSPVQTCSPPATSRQSFLGNSLFKDQVVLLPPFSNLTLPRPPSPSLYKNLLPTYNKEDLQRILGATKSVESPKPNNVEKTPSAIVNTLAATNNPVPVSNNLPHINRTAQVSTALENWESQEKSTDIVQTSQLSSPMAISSFQTVASNVVLTESSQIHPSSETQKQHLSSSPKETVYDRNPRMEAVKPVEVNTRTSTTSPSFKIGKLSLAQVIKEHESRKVARSSTPAKYFSFKCVTDPPDADLSNFDPINSFKLTEPSSSHMSFSNSFEASTPNGVRLSTTMTVNQQNNCETTHTSSESPGTVQHLQLDDTASSELASDVDVNIYLQSSSVSVPGEQTMPNDENIPKMDITNTNPVSHLSNGNLTNFNENSTDVTSINEMPSNSKNDLNLPLKSILKCKSSPTVMSPLRKVKFSANKHVRVFFKADFESESDSDISEDDQSDTDSMDDDYSDDNENSSTVFNATSLKKFVLSSFKGIDKKTNRGYTNECKIHFKGSTDTINASSSSANNIENNNDKPSSVKVKRGKPYKSCRKVISGLEISNEKKHEYSNYNTIEIKPAKELANLSLRPIFLPHEDVNNIHEELQKQVWHLYNAYVDLGFRCDSVPQENSVIPTSEHLATQTSSHHNRAVLSSLPQQDGINKRKSSPHTSKSKKSKFIL